MAASPNGPPQDDAEGLRERERERRVATREAIADRRERIADERERLADARERAADERERLADEREGTAERRERDRLARVNQAGERNRARQRARPGPDRS